MEPLHNIIDINSKNTDIIPEKYWDNILPLDFKSNNIIVKRICKYNLPQWPTPDDYSSDLKILWKFSEFDHPTMNCCILATQSYDDVHKDQPKKIIFVNHYTNENTFRNTNTYYHQNPSSFKEPQHGGFLFIIFYEIAPFSTNLIDWNLKMMQSIRPVSFLFYKVNQYVNSKKLSVQNINNFNIKNDRENHDIIFYDGNTRVFNLGSFTSDEFAQNAKDKYDAGLEEYKINARRDFSLFSRPDHSMHKF